MFRRIALFLAVNILVVFMISLVLSIFNVRPYIQAYGLDYSSLLIFCFVWGVGGALISLLLSKKIAIWTLKVRLLKEKTLHQDEKKLFDLVRKISLRAGLKKIPAIGIYFSHEPNAFATGPSERSALIAVSSALLERMSDEELEGVLSHEMAHIKNKDMVTMTLLQGVVNAFVMFLARILAYALSGLGRSKDSNGRGGSFMGYYMLTILFEMVFMVLGSMVIATYSRFREFRADKKGAELSSNKAMIQALKALQRMENIQNEKESPMIAALKISHKQRKGLLSLFATHPPLQVRIERLEAQSKSFSTV